MLRGKNPWWRPAYPQWPDRSDAAWVTLPAVGEPLDGVVHVGSGKDAYLVFELASGRTVELATNGVRVDTECPVEITTTAWGDRSLWIEYRGNDLVLAGGRMSFSGDLEDPWVDMFRRDAQAWIASGLKGELRYAVAVELRLGSSSADMVAAA